MLMVIYTFLAYIAITFHMALVQEFGGITTGEKLSLRVCTVIVILYCTVLFCTVQLLLYDFHHLIGYVIFLTTVLVGNTRKAMTIVLSFILFPKPYNWMYGAGGVLVFGSLIGNALMKEKSSKMSGGGGKKDGGIISGV